MGLMNTSDREKLKQIECFLLDMDGTIYLGETLINGASDFLATLKRQKKKAMYITNNSSKATQQYVEKLARLGISAKEEDFFTSAHALVYNMQRHHGTGASVFLLGTPALEAYLLQNGFKIVKKYFPDTEHHPDYVVLAFDTTLTYEKLRIACDYITDGVEYWATHPDMVCPVDKGRFVPDAGSFMECIHGVTGKMPSFIAGKPNPCMIRVILEKYGYSPDSVAVVGDRLNTDIMAAINAGVTSICVLTGEATQEDIAALPDEERPTYVLQSVQELYDILCS